MNIYAQINENKICTGISQLSGEVLQDNMIEITSFSEDYMWKKYENGVWSSEKYEPNSTAPINDFENLKAENEQLKETQGLMQEALDFLLMGGV